MNVAGVASARLSSFPELPEDWTLKPLKRVTRFVEGPGIMAADFEDSGVPLLRIAGLGGRRASLDGCNFLSPHLVEQRWSHFRVRIGDLLISASASTGLCAEADEDIAGAIPYTGIIIMRPVEGQAERDFLRWFFLSESFATQVILAQTGSALQHYGPTHLSQMFIAVPPISAQRAIADYLDRETARIDALIAAKEQVLGLLAEKRRALITRAVTRGLDPHAPLRDSGIPWLGEIPAHWDLTRLKFAARVQTGIALGKNFGGKELHDYPYLRVANVQDGFLALTDVKTIAVPESEAALSRLRAGDVLMNEGGDADKLGRGAIWEGEIEPCLHQNHVFAVRPRTITSEWLASWTACDVAKAYFESRAKQSTNLASISATNLMELPLLRPPVAEQGAIVEHIRRESVILESIQSVTERSVALLNERRAALIVAAVSGQIDVGAAV